MLYIIWYIFGFITIPIICAKYNLDFRVKDLILSATIFGIAGIVSFILGMIFIFCISNDVKSKFLNKKIF